MICPKCHNEISDDSRFCSQCGAKLKKCSNCGEVNLNEARFCHHCGTAFPETMAQSYQQAQTYTPLSQPETPLGEPGSYQPLDANRYQEPVQEVVPEEVSHKPHWKIIIIAVVALALITSGSYYYLTHSQKLNATASTSGTYNKATFTALATSKIEKESNLMNLGTADSDGTHVYMTNDSGYLVQLTKSFTDEKVLVSEKVNYINVVGDTIYYTNSSYYLCSIKTDGSDAKTLLKSRCFYLTYNSQDKKIYYQSDSDNESLYVYDLASASSQKLLDQHVYNLSIADSKIYFTSKDGIYAYDLTSKKAEKLVESTTSQPVSGAIYKDGYVYYVKYYSLMRYSVSTKKSETIVSASSTMIYSFLMSDKAIYFYGASGSVYRIDLTSKEIKTIYEGGLSSSTDFQVLGDQLLVKSSSHWKCVNTSSTKYARIFK